MMLRTFLACIALLMVGIGLRWLQLFVLTDYRAHFRPIIIPLGMMFTAVGIILFVRQLKTKPERG